MKSTVIDPAQARLLCRILLVLVACAASAAFGKTARELDALVAQMTLSEKVGQLVQISTSPGKDPVSKDASDLGLSGKIAARVRRGEAGTLIGACGVKNFNALQKIAVEQSRLRIPLLVGHDLIHGALTQLPIPLALSCCWDEAVWRACGELIGREGPLKGCNWTFTPMVDISRDARWGRIAESPGQDVLIASRMSAAFVTGIQDRRHPAPMAACLKHFVGYGAAIGGRDYNAVEMSESTLRNVYLPPFKAGIDAGALTVMPGFHSFNGVPCGMNRWLLTDILRGELGFKGLTVSDWSAVSELGEGNHGMLRDGEAIVAAAVSAGLDVDMMSMWEAYHRCLAKSVEKGKLPMSALDQSVKNVLRVKNALGLFENPYIDERKVRAHCDLAAHAAFAREVAAKSCVLLKNARGTLPLKPGVKVALVGPSADDIWNFIGCWSTDPQNRKNGTLVEGLKAEGVDFVQAVGYGWDDEPVDEAALRAVAEKGDVVLALFGEYGLKSGENQSRARLELGASQLRALDVLKATVKPLVALLGGGRPLAVPELAEKADAMLAIWSPGSSGGQGVVDVLTGRVNPSGRLTVDFLSASGQCPVYYDRTRTGRPNERVGKVGLGWQTRYRDCPNGGLYPFGYGLSYTSFDWTNAQARVVGTNLVCTVEIANTGSHVGTETVQVYATPAVAQDAPPRRRLVEWRRIELKPGASTEVELTIPLSRLSYWSGSERRPVRGELKVWIAPHSNAGTCLSVELPD